MATRMPIMATTTISSTIVKARRDIFLFRDIFYSVPFGHARQGNMPRILPTSDVIAHPFVIKAHTAVVRSRSVTAHLGVRGRAREVRDALDEGRMEQDHRVGRRLIAAAVGEDVVEIRLIEDAV